jgi:flavin reductase (DIM6/NTAB) family NADH-FMN oxidoreductase RutF
VAWHRFCMTQHSTFAPSPETKPQLRAALGRFTTGVTVITTHTPMGPMGMTANSFTSLSLDPPLVMWAPGLSSKRHDAFVQAAHFCIHVLCADQSALASHFATRGDGFEGFGFDVNAKGVPLFDGCAARIECDAYATHPAGDHTMVVGQVRQVSMQDSAGLAFSQGKFGQFAAFE